MYTSIFILLFFSEDVKCYVDKLLRHLQLNSGIRLLFKAVPIYSRFFSFLSLGVFFVVLNYICLSFVQIYAILHFNYIIYSGLLIFCCQNVAIFTLIKHILHDKQTLQNFFPIYVNYLNISEIFEDIDN